MNKVVLMGRLTKDPEVRYSSSDTPIAIVRYTLAVRRTFSKSNEGEADFINVVAFGKRGEFAEKYFAKYQMVSVAGRIQQDVWEDAEHLKHSRFEVIAEEQQGASKSNNLNDEISKDLDNEIAVASIEEEDLP